MNSESGESAIRQEKPTKHCSDVIKKYCSEDILNPSAIREISTVVNELYQIKKLNELDVIDIEAFLELQHNILQESKEFPFDLIEISLTFYASPEMPQTIYNDDWVTLLIKKLTSTCNEQLFNNKENLIMIHRLYPIFKLLAQMVLRCSLSDSLLASLTTIAGMAYFHKASSVPLQSSACGLLTAVFKKCRDFRSTILDEIFFDLNKNQGNPRVVTFGDGERRQLSALSVLLIEFIQSTAVFPADADTATQAVMDNIIIRLMDEKKTQYLERFGEDLVFCLTHPLYPAALVIENRLLQHVYSQISQKSRLSTVAIKIFCKGLAAILSFNKHFGEPITVSLKKGVYSAFRPDIREIILNDEFPQSEPILLTAEFCVLLFIRQTQRQIGGVDTSTQFFVMRWSDKELDQEQTDCLYSWWRNGVPDIFDSGINLEICESIISYLQRKHPLFQNVHAIITRLLSGLNNSNSKTRGQVLKGFASIVKENTTFLYHPDLIPHIKGAFVDPCPTIRDGALELISTYIYQNEQVLSPYFPVVVSCLQDSSPAIVRRALVTLGALAQSASEEQLISLTQILKSKMEDEAETVRNSARSLLSQSIFEISSDPFVIFSSLIDAEWRRPKWFEGFVRDSFQKHSQKMNNIINDTISKTCESLSLEHSILLKELSEILPSSVQGRHDEIITAVLMSENKLVISNLLYSLIYIIPVLVFPKMTAFEQLIDHLQSLIYSESTVVVRPALELAARISEYVLPGDDIIKNIQTDFAQLLLKNVNKKDSIDGEVMRAIFVIGVSIRIVGWIADRTTISKVMTTISSFFKSPNKGVRRRVLCAAVDICVRDERQLRTARGLVQAAFGCGDGVEAVRFLHELLKEEDNIEDTTALDEHRASYSQDMLSHFQRQIIKLAGDRDQEARTASLDLIGTAVSHGLMNVYEAVPQVIGLLSARAQHSKAMEILKNASFTAENAMKTRITAGLELAYKFESEMPEQALPYGAAELYKIVKPEVKKMFIKVLAAKSVLALDNEKAVAKVTPSEIKWVCEIAIRMQFQYQWEPYLFVHRVFGHTKVIAPEVLVNASDALVDARMEGKAIDISTWYAAILVLRTKRYITKRYKVNMRKIILGDKVKEDKRQVRVDLVQPPDLSPPVPKEVEYLSDTLLDLYAMLSSAMRHERAALEKNKPVTK